jgi:acetolactate synthase-1/2/3 large subunit
MPITKHNFLVKDSSQLAAAIRLAFVLARTGRPGPVLIDVPRDVQTAMVDYEETELSYPEPEKPDCEKIRKAVAAINAAERPVMLIGGGVINSNTEYDAMDLAEKLQIPVVSTLMGLGACSAYRSLFLGMTGLHGHEKANNAVKEADLILAFGSRFNDRVTGERGSYVAHKTFVHMDIDPAELDKNIYSEIGIAGDMKMTLNKLTEACSPKNLEAWWRQIAAWPSNDEDCGEAETPTFFRGPQSGCSRTATSLSRPMSATPDVVRSDIKIQFARQWVTSGGLVRWASLAGSGGRPVARPNSRVISISGDGGFKNDRVRVIYRSRQLSPCNFPLFLTIRAWHDSPAADSVFLSSGLPLVKCRLSSTLSNMARRSASRVFMSNLRKLWPRRLRKRSLKTTEDY